MAEKYNLLGVKDLPWWELNGKEKLPQTARTYRIWRRSGHLRSKWQDYLFNYSELYMKDTAAVPKQIQANVPSPRLRGKYLFWSINPFTIVLVDFFGYSLWNKSLRITIADAALEYVPLQSDSLWQFLFPQLLKTEALEKFNSKKGKTVLFPKRVIWNQSDLNTAPQRLLPTRYPQNQKYKWWWW